MNIFAIPSSICLPIQEASRNKCHATSNKCLTTSSNKKLVVTMSGEPSISDASCSLSKLRSLSSDEPRRTTVDIGGPPHLQWRSCFCKLLGLGATSELVLPGLKNGRSHHVSRHHVPPSEDSWYSFKASSNKCHATSNKCLTSSNKKLVVTRFLVLPWNSIWAHCGLGSRLGGA